MLVVERRPDGYSIAEIKYESKSKIYNLISDNYLYRGLSSQQVISELFIGNTKLILIHIDILSRASECIIIEGDGVEDTLNKIKKHPDTFYLVSDISKSICNKFILYLIPLDEHVLFKGRNQKAIREYIINELYCD